MTHCEWQDCEKSLISKAVLIYHHLSCQKNQKASFFFSNLQLTKKSICRSESIKNKWSKCTFSHIFSILGLLIFTFSFLLAQQGNVLNCLWNGMINFWKFLLGNKEGRGQQFLKRGVGKSPSIFASTYLFFSLIFLANKSPESIYSFPQFACQSWSRLKQASAEQKDWC